MKSAVRSKKLATSKPARVRCNTAYFFPFLTNPVIGAALILSLVYGDTQSVEAQTLSFAAAFTQIARILVDYVRADASPQIAWFSSPQALSLNEFL